MSAMPSVLDPKLNAVLARLCERLGSLTKTQAVKLPYLVDVVAAHALGRRITSAQFQTWKHGVVASEVWRFAKHPGRVGSFEIEEEQYSEGSVSIRHVGQSPIDLSQEELEVVDYVADEFGGIYYDKLGFLTKVMNLEVRIWGSNKLARIDEEAYIRLIGRWDRALAVLERYDTEDLSTEEELNGDSLADLRKSLGV